MPRTRISPSCPSAGFAGATILGGGTASEYHGVVTRTVRTMCPMNCHPTLCGMLVEVEDGRVTRVTGDPDNPDSRGFLCVRGQAAPEILDNPKRLLHPMLRATRGGPWRRATWDEALDLVARSALGRRIVRNTFHVGAPKTRPRSSSSSSTCVSPTAVLITTGKKPMSAAMSTLGRMP